MAACGFYGKIPSEGDFVSRRLPWEFTSVWDAWLQQGMQASKEALGPRWLELYLSAPIWRFQIAPGVCGTQGWRGLFFASVDRVGRYFPLTLAFAEPAMTGASASHAALVAEEAAWLAVEDTALAGLDPALSIDDFDRAIAALAAPGASPDADADRRAAVCLLTRGAPLFAEARLALPSLPPAAGFTELIASAALRSLTPRLP